MKTATAAKEVEKAATPRCLVTAINGIKTGKDFASFMSALMSDIVEGNVSPNVGNAAVNAGGKLLKVVEMEYKYGKKGEQSDRKTILLASE